MSTKKFKAALAKIVLHENREANFLGDQCTG